MALPAQNRLSLRFNRDRLTREGKTFHTRHFTIVTASPPVIPSDKTTLQPSTATRHLERSREISLHKTTPSSLRNSPPLEGVSSTLDPKQSPIMKPRFAILLSKKTARQAVDRNLIKRKTSAAIENLLPSFPVADYLIIPKRSVLDTPVSNLISDLESYTTSSRA